jgi:hypothetical protein
MLAMKDVFMSESATVGLELLELRVRKGVIRGGRAQGNSCKQKGRQRQRSELEGHNAVVKTSNEGGCYEYAMKMTTRVGRKMSKDPRNTRYLLLSCSKSRGPYIRSDHGRKD